MRHRYHQRWRIKTLKRKASNLVFLFPHPNMPAKVVLNRTCGSDIFVYADPDMVKEWRHNHSAPLEFILTGKYHLHMKNVLFIFLK